MNTYKNTYFQLKIEFPEEWTFRSSAKNPDSKVQFQTADDDLPTQEQDHRSLVTAIRKGRGKHKLIGAEFFIGIHKQSNQPEPGEFEKKEGIVESTYGQMTILENQAQFIKTVKEAGGNYLFSKTITYEIRPQIWIVIHFNGDTIDNFQSAENLLEKLSRLR